MPRIGTNPVQARVTILYRFLNLLNRKISAWGVVLDSWVGQQHKSNQETLLRYYGMFWARIRRFSIVSLWFSLLLLVGTGIFVYQVSPLREPTFQPNSANAGSLVPWLQGVTEGHWFLVANILAFLLSTNLTLILWQQRVSNKNNWLPHFMLMILVWLILFIIFRFVFIIYLLHEWLID